MAAILDGSGDQQYAVQYLTEFLEEALVQEVMRVYNIKGSSLAKETVYIGTDLPLYSERLNELADVTAASAEKWGSKDYTHVEYSLRVEIPEGKAEDNPTLHGDYAIALARRGAHTLAKLLALPFMNFTSTASPYAMANGEALASDTHALKGGGTFDNLLGAALSHDNILAAQVVLLNQLSEAGVKDSQQGKYLIVPPALQAVAKQIVESMYTSAALQVNTTRGKLEVITVPWFTDASDWVLMAERNGADCFLRTAPYMVYEHVVSNFIHRFAARMRVSFGFSNWHGTVCST